MKDKQHPNTQVSEHLKVASVNDNKCRGITMKRLALIFCFWCVLLVAGCPEDGDQPNYAKKHSSGSTQQDPVVPVPPAVVMTVLGVGTLYMGSRRMRK